MSKQIINPPPMIQWYKDETGKVPGEFYGPAYTALIHEAAKDPFLGDFVLKKKPAEFRWFLIGEHNDTLAGFAIPRRDSDGYYRTGAIYVKPEYRKQGIAAAFVKQYFQGKKGRAYIEDANAASIALFTSIGFKKTGKTVKDGNEVLHEYLKREE
ncbi:hypothetical protein [Burkholderia phage FLC9]|nr:hypothetical protein [Burkholderia phage FLC9]